MRLWLLRHLAGLCLAVAALAVVLSAAPAHAVQPDEMLADPALEARARDISAGLRCLVCQNESIDASEADLARDLRLLVRKRLVAGDSDQEVVDYMVARYGEFVLLRPRFDWQTLALWGTPVVVLCAGAGFAFLSWRGRRRQAGPSSLSPEEAARVEALLRSGD
ncbi:cytochrome c-type biogenesis protein [Mangrovibrevibacter kandeliae]|uniref:cytochrome c-type biogenesis protein n=1 Tax=Mangrovibrevibacter kandeliae TaxID=2968473 RepID=UPI0021188F5C|nr:cytochrome c-type biogenesis protein [Aurantimonas sp. CSK15Z-1]MCQ8781098.1 cytochrome c-type biogenesis protein CcmH [Aurantimonas sp. CSK15Z-1]